MEQISRREFMASAMAGGIAAMLPNVTEAENAGKKTRYIAAYDTEQEACLAAVRKIVEVHKRCQMPATFFIVGQRLANPKEFKELLRDPLFEVASHGYSHVLLREHVFGPPPAGDEEKRKEIFKSKEVIEAIYERKCIGFRPAYGFDGGFKGARDVLGLIKEAGYDYVSSLLLGAGLFAAGSLTEPFNYAADGFPGIWELPAHGWHENLLKDNNSWGSRRLTLWPPVMPEAIPLKAVSNPQEEFEVNKIFLEKAARDGNSYVSFIWHPWSLGAFDPEMKMLELTFEHVRGLGLEPSTYAGLFNSVSA